MSIGAMRDPPLAWFGTPRETRTFGALACALFTIGSLLFALTALDLGRYATFVCTAARFVDATRYEGPPMALRWITVLLSCAALLGSMRFVSERGQRGILAWIVGSLAVLATLSAIAQCVRTFHSVVGDGLAFVMGPTVHDALEPVAVVYLLAAGALAVALVCGTPGSKRAVLATTVLPMVIAGAFLGDALVQVPELDPWSIHVATRLDALMQLLARAQPVVLAASVPGVVGALLLRARASVALGGSLWLLLAVMAFVVTRPVATDASDTSRGSILRDFADGGCQSFFGAAAQIRPLDDAQISTEIEQLVRARQILHPRQPIAVGLERFESTPEPLVAGWVRAARALGFEEIWLVTRRDEVWRTETLGPLRRTTLCASRALLDGAPRDQPVTARAIDVSASPAKRAAPFERGNRGYDEAPAQSDRGFVRSIVARAAPSRRGRLRLIRAACSRGPS